MSLVPLPPVDSSPVPLPCRGCRTEMMGSEGKRGSGMRQGSFLSSPFRQSSSYWFLGHNLVDYSWFLVEF